MSTNADELKLDIKEINNLLQQANRQRVKNVLNLEVRRLETELAKLTDENKTESVKATSTVSNSNKCYEVKLNNYGWDQTNTTVKLYVTLKDVHHLPKEGITCNFTEKSLDLRVIELENKNYSLKINNLCEEIDVNKSSYKVKTDMIVVSLIKKIAQDWSHVTEVEKRIKVSKTSAIPNVNEDSDPSGVFMKFIKKMYQEGDDEMKKIIAKSWTERQEAIGSGQLNFK